MSKVVRKTLAERFAETAKLASAGRALGCHVWAICFVARQLHESGIRGGEPREPRPAEGDEREPRTLGDVFKMLRRLARQQAFTQTCTLEFEIGIPISG